MKLFQNITKTIHMQLKFKQNAPCLQNLYLIYFKPSEISFFAIFDFISSQKSEPYRYF